MKYIMIIWITDGIVRHLFPSLHTAFLVYLAFII